MKGGSCWGCGPSINAIQTLQGPRPQFPYLYTHRPSPQLWSPDPIGQEQPQPRPQGRPFPSGHRAKASWEDGFGSTSTASLAHKMQTAASTFTGMNGLIRFSGE